MKFSEVEHIKYIIYTKHDLLFETWYTISNEIWVAFMIPVKIFVDLYNSR